MKIENTDVHKSAIFDYDKLIAIIKCDNKEQLDVFSMAWYELENSNYCDEVVEQIVMSIQDENV